MKQVSKIHIHSWYRIRPKETDRRKLFQIYQEHMSGIGSRHMKQVSKIYIRGRYQIRKKETGRRKLLQRYQEHMRGIGSRHMKKVSKNTYPWFVSDMQ